MGYGIVGGNGICLMRLSFDVILSIMYILYMLSPIVMLKKKKDCTYSISPDFSLISSTPFRNAYPAPAYTSWANQCDNAASVSPEKENTESGNDNIEIPYL